MSNLKGFLSKAKAMSRSTLSVVLVLCLLLLMVPSVLLVAADGPWDGTSIADSFADGDGSAGDPYQIATGAQLAYLAKTVNEGTNYNGLYLKLTDDIDLNDKEWTKIGDTSAHAFKGTLDGDGHTISNLYVTGSAGNAGLFGFAAGAIKNLNLEGNVNVTKAGAAAFVGYATGSITFKNCVFSGDISVAASADSASTAVFVGGNWNCGTITIEKCAAVNTTITVTRGTLTYAPQSTGGFVGTAASGTDVVIEDSYFSGTVNGGNGTGGLVGSVFYGNSSTNPSEVTIRNSYTEGTIAGQGSTGGLIGYLRPQSSNNKPIIVDIQDCYSTAAISSNSASHNVSGLIGASYASSDDLQYVTVKIQNSFFTGSAKYPIFFKNGTSNLNAASKFINVYYKTGSATATSDLTPAATCQKDATAFTDSTVLGLIDAGRNVWYQGPTHPVFPQEPKITNLEVTPGQLEFNAEVTEYDLYFENNVHTLTVKPTVEAGTSVTVAGTPLTGDSVVVALTADDTTAIDVVISRDGTQKTFTVYATCGDLWDGTAKPYPNANEENAGTAENPYEIALPEHLAYMAKQVNEGNETGKYYELTDDIVLAGKQWTPIGNSSKKFSGTFDGNGHTIKGLYINTTATYQGLFGVVAGNTTINDVKIERANITSYSNVGGFIATASGTLKMSGCSFNGSITSTTGQNDKGDFAATGGLIGSVSGGTVTIEKCTVEEGTSITARRGATLTWNFQGVGGLVGGAQASAAITVTVQESSSAADITCVQSNGSKDGHGVGGIIGYVRNTNSTNTATIKVAIHSTYTSGTVSAYGTSGGLLGFLRTAGETATGKVAAEISDSYSTMTGLTSGLVGKNYNDKDNLSSITVSIKNSYFAGPAEAAGQPIMNYAGTNGSINLTVQNAYYLQGSNKDANILSSALNNQTINISNVTEKTADEMKSADFVALLNANAGIGVWELGTDSPALQPSLKLQGIKLSKAMIGFDPATFTYQATVPSAFDKVTVTATTEDPSHVITIGGNPATSGQASAPIAISKDGVTVIEVKVMRGTVTKTYTISVTTSEGWDGKSAIAFPNIDDETAGTAANPYQITLPEHLEFMRLLAEKGVHAKNEETKISTTTLELDGETYTVYYPNSALGKLYGAHFKLMNDIDLSNQTNGTDQAWTSTEFRGHLDGGGHTVSGFTTTLGFFSNLSYGSVSNLKVEGTVSGGTADSVGGIAGQMAGGSKLTNSSFTGTVSGANKVGGLVGQTLPYSGGANFNITACWTSGTVTGTGSNIGGLVGFSGFNPDYGGTVHLKDCYSAMTVQTTAADTVDNMAGLVGSGDVTYRNSFFVGQIDSAYPIGFSKTHTVGSVYYKEGTYNSDKTSANAGFVGGTKKTAAEINSDALVALLNTYAAPGVVWAKGTDHPVLTYTDPGEVEATADPFHMIGLTVEHAAFTFSPSQFTCALSLPYSAEKIQMLPEAPAGTTLTVDGKEVKPQAFSQAIALEVGVEKTVVIKVALGDSYTSYELTLTRREKPANGAWDGALEVMNTKNKKGQAIDDPIIIDTPGKLAFLAAMTNGNNVMLNGEIYKAPSAAAGQLYKGYYFEITNDLIMNDVSNYDEWGTDILDENDPTKVVGTVLPENVFIPIGYHSDTVSLSRTFAGTVNGNDHKIIGLYVDGKTIPGGGGIGLFGSVENGTLRNIHIEQSYVSGSQRVGGLVGRPRAWITAQNCSFSGTVHGTMISKTSNSMVGGLFGDCIAKAFVNSCWTEGTVKGGHSLGGLIGQAYVQTGLEVKNSYSVATVVPLYDKDVLCDNNVGGLIGVISGKAGSIELYRTHFAGKVQNGNPVFGGKSEGSGVVVSASDTVYYRADSYVGEVDSTYTYSAVEKTVEEFADGTVTDLLNNLVEFGDYWNWETAEEGYPASDGKLLVTDYRDHTSDEYFDDGEWYLIFTNKPGGTLKDPSGNKGDADLDGDGYNDYDDDYDNNPTGEKSLVSAVLILALISAVAAFLLARRKRSIN